MNQPLSSDLVHGGTESYPAVAGLLNRPLRHFPLLLQEKVSRVETAEM